MHRTVFPPTNQFLSVDSRRKERRKDDCIHIYFSVDSHAEQLHNRIKKRGRKDVYLQ